MKTTIFLPESKLELKLGNEAEHIAKNEISKYTELGAKYTLAVFSEKDHHDLTLICGRVFNAAVNLEDFLYLAEVGYELLQKESGRKWK